MLLSFHNFRKHRCSVGRKQGILLFCAAADTEYESKKVSKLSGLARSIMEQTDLLDKTLSDLGGEKDIIALSHAYRNRVFEGMEKLRVFVDEAETLTDSAHWPYPTYGDLMFSVK